MNKKFQSILLFILIFLSLKSSIYAAELQDYGFENFEEIDDYLSSLIELTNPFEERSAFKTERFMNFCDKVLDNTLSVLTSKLLDFGVWVGFEVPEIFASYYDDFFSFKNSEDISFTDVFDRFCIEDYCYFATKDEIDEPCNVVIIGDIHGNYLDFGQIIRDLINKEILTENLKLTTGNRIVFLGDFVDRGDRSLELVLFLFLLKILNPEMITILKGNHEDFLMTNHGGFREELFSKLGSSSALSIYGGLLCLFYFLPEAFYLHGLNKRFMFCHGGWNDDFDCEDFLNNNDMIFKKTFFGKNFNQLSPFLWNDISPFLGITKFVAGRGYMHPTNYILKQMKLDSIDAIFKGHDHQMPKKVEFSEIFLRSKHFEKESCGFCELSKNKIFLIISTSIYQNHSLMARYKPSYGLLSIDDQTYSCQGIVCSEFLTRDDF